MTPESVMMMGTEAMKVALALAAPLLLVALVTGLIISILQAATQINEMTLSFIPKIIAVFIAIIILLPLLLPDRGCSICCWITSAPCSLTCRISSGSRTMLQVTSEQWLSWLSLYFWPLLRVLALISTAPILSERSVPKRVKLGLAMMITFAIAPSLPANDVPVFSFFALWLAVQQILIGIALGFTMQFAFAAVRTAGEIIGLQMGLSFATFVDPASHLNMPVLARIMDMLALLLFLTFNGHLWLISLLVDTFHTLPIGGEPLNSNAFLALTKAGSLIFLNGLMLALPLITLLLTLNLALGLLNRMAPQLSIFVIGFPLTLTVGISLMAALMPLIASFCEHLFSEIFNLLADIISELPLI